MLFVSQERRHVRKSSKHHKRRGSRDCEKSKRRSKDDTDDNHKSRRDKDRRDTRSDRRRSDEGRVKDKRSRRHDERKHKSRHRSRSPRKTSHRRHSSSQEREKKLQVRPAAEATSKPSPSTSSSSPQKSPMISLGSTSKPPEPNIELPAYYNPNVINVTKFAEQQKKRKLIWSGKKDEPPKNAVAKWGGAKFSQDTDGTKASKFMRLMGIKDVPKPEATAAPKPSDELFSTMEQQYEVARQVTHISRGVGLGFGSRPF